MFTVNEDLSIYVTRGDACTIPITAEDVGVGSVFPAGTVLRIKVYGKKNCENVVLQKDFPAWNDTPAINIVLNESDTKIGGIINKPKDYWYEVEMNPNTDPHTIVGYSEDGAMVFKLFPEGNDIPDEPIEPEDIPVVDVELDLTSSRPVENKAIAKAVASLRADLKKTSEAADESNERLTGEIESAKTAISVERARINAFTSLATGSTTGDAELIDGRVGSDGASYANIGTAIRTQTNRINREMGFDTHDISANATEGKFVNENGSIYDNSGFLISAPIFVPAGYSIIATVKGYNTNVSIFSKYSDTGVNEPLVISTTSEDNEYRYTADADMNICVCFSVNTINKVAVTIANVVKSIEKLDDVVEKTLYTIVNTEQGTDGKYVSYQGGIEDAAGYRYTNPVFLYKGSKIKFIGKGYNSNVAFISAYNDGVYTPLVLSSTSQIENIDYTTQYDGYYVFCFSTASLYKVTVENDVYGLFSRVTDLETVNSSINTNYMGMFHRIAVIGDSLASGEIVNGDNVRDCYEYSWLSHIARKNNLKCYHYSRGGMTAKKWLSGEYRTAMENEADVPTAYFIALGTNDKNQDVYPLGTINDDAGTESFVGYMKQIIGAVKSKAPNAVIFILSLYTDTGRALPYSAMLQEIASQDNSCYFLDYADNMGIVDQKLDNAYAASSHFTTVGYMACGDIIEKLVNSQVTANMDNFKWFGLNNSSG